MHMHDEPLFPWKHSWVVSFAVKRVSNFKMLLSSVPAVLLIIMMGSASLLYWCSDGSTSSESLSLITTIAMAFDWSGCRQSISFSWVHWICFVDTSFFVSSTQQSMLSSVSVLGADTHPYVKKLVQFFPSGLTWNPIDEKKFCYNKDAFPPWMSKFLHSYLS